MTLSQYWMIVVKRYKLIVICLLLVGLGALVGSKLMTPLYQSTALVQIVIPSTDIQSDYTSLLADEQLVQTEAILATSDPILRTVASHFRGLTVAQLTKEVTATPKINTQIFEIDVLDPSPTRAAAITNDIAQTLIQQQLLVAQQQNAHTYSYFLIAQPAQPVFTPVRPNILLNTGAGLLAGLLLGMLLAVLLEQLDPRVRTPEALGQLLNWPILGIIWKDDAHEEMIGSKAANANAEAYRMLRTNIGFSAIDRPLQTLVVTSASPGDGKSTVAANLAIFMARAGKKTVLIDANLRRPTLHEIFHLPDNTVGLSNAILTFSTSTMSGSRGSRSAVIPDTPAPSSIAYQGIQVSLEPFFQTVDVPNLYIMPSGSLPPNPTELLDSKAMKSLFAALSCCGAQIVIFDTPPLLSVSDASVVAARADGTVVVVDIAHTKSVYLKQVQTLLEHANAHVLGCIVNKQHRSRNHKLYSSYSSTDSQDSQDEQSAGDSHEHQYVEATDLPTVTVKALKGPDKLFNGIYEETK